MKIKHNRFQTFGKSQGILPFGSLLMFLFFISSSAFAKTDYRSIVEVGLLGDFYFADKSKSNAQGYGSILIEYNKDNHRMWVDIGAGGLLGSSGHSFVKAPQFFYQVGTQDVTSFYFGRWITTWSEMDEEWHLGITQPRFLWDSSRPESQGLTGVFFVLNSLNSDFHMTTFVSGLFLPDQGASFTLINGNLRSSNPWFFPPVQALSFGGNQFDLNYSLATPKAADVLLRLSAGLKLQYNKSNPGFYAQGFFFHKPKNDLVLPFEGSLNLTTFQGDVVIHPVIAQHNVGGLDVGFRWARDRGLVRFSWMGEQQIFLKAPENTTYPNFSDQNILGVTGELKITDSQKLKAGYLKVIREDTRAAGVYGSSSIDVFGFRNRFEEALRLEWNGQFIHKDNVPTLKSTLAVTFDPRNQSSWIKGKLSWWARRGVELSAQCDFFGSQSLNISGDDFLSRFQNNDRCLVGGSYAF